MRRVTSLLALSCFALFGCSLALLDTPVENTCTTNADCATNMCSEGMCISEAAVTFQVALEVTANHDPISQTAVSEPLGVHSFDGPTTLDLNLLGSISVIGNLRWEDSGDPVDAEVTFWREGLNAEERIEYSAATVRDPGNAADGRPADFAVRLVRGEDYTIRIRPTGDSALRAPSITTQMSVPPAGDFVRFDIDYPSDLTEISGRIQSATAEGVDDLQVRAVHRETGEVVSSVSITETVDRVAGSFSLALDRSVAATDYVFRISAGADRPLFPTVVVDPEYLFPGEGGETVIVVPELSSIRYTGTVEREGSDGLGLLDGATLTFRASNVYDGETGIEGSFRATVTTDDKGQFEAELLPGTYEILVTPPPEQDDVGVRLSEGFRIETGDELSGQVFELPRRALLTGEVTTDSDEVMGGAQLRANALHRDHAADEASRYNRSSDVTADETGRFSLPLDVGFYDIVVRPPAGNGFPWLVAPNQVVEASGAMLMRSFEFPAPLPVTGVIRDQKGDPLVLAEVRAFAIIEDADGNRRTVPIGRAISDENGAYQLLLPPAIH